MSNQSGLLAIIGKEFRRFFTDRRIVLTTILLPGLTIYIVYSFMGNALNNILTVDEGYQPAIYAVNMPESLDLLCRSAGLDFTAVSMSDVSAIQSHITGKEADLLVIFPADFDERVTAQLSGEQGIDPPRIEVFYNSTRTESSHQYSTMMSLLDYHKTQLAPLFTINTGADDHGRPGADTGGEGATGEGTAGNAPTGSVPSYDLASEEDAAGFIFASIMPMLIMVLLFSGCMAVAPESISGEKERGTIATMLVTPLARWELALGKIIALSCIALLSGLSSFVAIMLSLPKLLGGMPGEAATALYSFSDYALLLAVILSSVLLFVGLISLLSALARTVKEAATYITPLMLVVMVVGAMGMFSSGSASNPIVYLIPVYNSVQCMIGILSFTITPLFIAITAVANIALTALCVLALTWMFGNEKVVFSK